MKYLKQDPDIRDIVERINFLLNAYGTPASIDDSVYQDYLISGTAVGIGVNAPDLANLRDGLYLYAFAGTGATVEQAFFTVHLLHDIKPGSKPTFHIHWTHNVASPTGNVKWNIEYSYARGYGVDAYPATTTISTVQAAGAQYTHHITPDDDMELTLTNMEPDMVLIGRIYRDPTDGSDTFGNDAFLIQIDLHYEVGQIGTYQRNRPFNGF